MKEFDNGNGVIKRDKAVDQLATLAGMFWADKDRSKKSYTKYSGGVTPKQAAAFGAGLAYAADLLCEPHEVTPARGTEAFQYLHDQLVGEERVLDDVFGYDPCEALRDMLDSIRSK